jgi:hypothetical protein
MRRNADCLEKPVQDVSSVVRKFGGHVTEAGRMKSLDRSSGDCARNHTDLNRVFLPVAHGFRPRSIPEALDNPTFCQEGPHSGF